MAPRAKSLVRRGGTPARVLGRAGLLAVLASVLWTAPAHALRLSPPDAHSPNTDEMMLAYWVMLVVAVAVAVLITAALLVAVVRFRDARGRRPQRFTAGRGVIAKVAVGLAVPATAIFVFGIVVADSARTVDPSGPNGLAAAGARSAQVPIKGVSPEALEAANAAAEAQEGPVQKPGEGEPLVIDAIAQQWLWRFEYPGGTPGQRTFSYGELVVPVDTSVVLEIDSVDVVHSWWVPALTGQAWAVPGTINRTWFKADETGTYSGPGTVFDGTSYPSLGAKVRVVEPAEYESYLEGLAEDLAEAQEAVRDETSLIPSESAGETP